jgi:1,2-diacylglycerol 3-beta-glucosyltransferase
MTTAMLLLATLVTGYYALTHLAGLGRRPPRVPSSPRTHFAVLVPAHDEETTLGTTLTSVQKLNYPPELIAVTVIADNCTDKTANVARSYGVTVLERVDPVRRGKGYALEDALASTLPAGPDAVLILDADAELAPDSLRAFDARFQTGARAVQGSIRTRNAAASPGTLVAAVGNVMDDRIAAGRDVLGLRVQLRGSAMAFRRDVLEQVPWACHGLTEDAEYSARLAAAGVRVRFEPAARCVSESAADPQALHQQRRRWRAALASPLDWVDSKPITAVQLLFTLIIVALFGSQFDIVWIAGLLIVNMLIYAFATAAAGGRLSHLAAAPAVVVRLAGVTLGGLVRHEQHWRRTPRAVVRSGEPAQGETARRDHTTLQIFQNVVALQAESIDSAGDGNHEELQSVPSR